MTKKIILATLLAAPFLLGAHTAGADPTTRAKEIETIQRDFKPRRRWFVF